MNLPVAKIINKQGKIVGAHTETIQQAMNQANNTESMQFSLVDSPHPEAYPMASFVYFIVNVSLQQPICQSAMELYRYVEWFLESPAAKDKTMDMNMIPLTSTLIQAIKDKVLNHFLCQGHSVKLLVEEQIWMEEESLKTWKIPVIISAVIAGIFLLMLASCLVYQRYAYYKKLTRKNWKIEFYDLEFKSKNENSIIGSETKMIEFDTNRNDLEVWNVILSLDEGPLEGGFGGKTIKLVEIELNFERTKAIVTEKLNSIMLLSHINVASFFGVAISPTCQTFYVEDSCSKGCITRLLCHQKFSVGTSLRFSIAREVCSGLLYLHSNKIFVGAMHIHQCMIDFRWTTKISQWALYNIDAILKRTSNKANNVVVGLNFFEAIKFQTLSSSSLHDYFKYWIAPEYSEASSKPFSSDKADIFSFGVILCAIFSIMKESDVESQTGATNSVNCERLDLFKPHSQHMPSKICNLVNLCCNSNPGDRPTLENISAALRANDPQSHMSVLDHVISLYEGSNAQ